MKINLAGIKSLESSLSKIFDKDVNIKIAYRLSKLLKRLSEEMSMMEESRIKLVTKYGKEDGETKQVTVPQENTADFYKEFNELMMVEIEIDFEPITLASLGNIELSAADVMKMDGKIIIGEEVKPVAVEVVEDKK